jgi:hypothetical protein
MADFTFLELHFHDSDLDASFSPGEKAVTATEEPPGEEPSSRKGTAFAALVGLAFLVAVAYVAKRKVLDGDDEGDETGTEPDAEGGSRFRLRGDA